MYKKTPTELVLWDVVEEHLDEAVFLFVCWVEGLGSPSFNLHQIEEGFEERLHEHLSAVADAGTAVIERLLYPDLETLRDPARTGYKALDLAALKAAGRSGRQDMIGQVERHYKDDDPAIRVAAVEAGLHLGSPIALACCRDEATSGASESARAMLLLALVGGPREHELVCRLPEGLNRPTERSPAVRF